MIDLILSTQQYPRTSVHGFLILTVKSFKLLLKKNLSKNSLVFESFFFFLFF